jgi:hypothetical protein
MNNLQYPVGSRPQNRDYSSQERTSFIQTIQDAPTNLSQAVKDLTQLQLNTPYREGGWSVRQVVHHISDSHINGFVRMKMALTEDTPLVATYAQNEWATLADSTIEIDVSVTLITVLHARWTFLMRSMLERDWKRGFMHPQAGVITLEQALAIYEWHSRHHVAHITELKKRMGWQTALQ